MSIVTPHRAGADGRARDAVVELDLDAVSLSRLRAAVRGLLAGCDDIRVEDAVQVCDELASNAVRHGAGPRACRLTATGDRTFRVEVDDVSPAPPRIRRPDHTGGNGLILVTRIATHWGVDHHRTGKTVWAELAGLTAR
ncbi:ATP-binding protein [Nocardia neocaledoniensis]|uniref:ATP-binding protein n=1 Tax=Nocardia neocaledoniensis TaxID=236511 RepID=UPI0024553E62|nr:ATP-binding protein [Nocardia neocaledoniensis]